MNEDMEPIKVLEAQPTGKISRGRPRGLYQEFIQRIGGKSINQMKRLSKDREEWLQWIEAPRRYQCHCEEDKEEDVQFYGHLG